MKTYLLAALLLIAGPAIAQKTAAAPPVGQESAEPFKNASVVVIHTSDSVKTAYKRMAEVLLSGGYTFDRTDEGLGALSTKSRPAPKLKIAHSLRAAVFPEPGGSRIELRDLFSMPGAAAISPIMTGESETKFKGMKGSPYMVCWDELARIGALYPAGKLAYKQ